MIKDRIQYVNEIITIGCSDDRQHSSIKLDRVDVYDQKYFRSPLVIDCNVLLLLLLYSYPGKYPERLFVTW